jgi:transcriptional regulator with GAF, ATPase, and Fis domain
MPSGDNSSTVTSAPERAGSGLGRRLLIAYSPTGRAEGRAKVLNAAAPLVLGRGEASALALESDGKLSREHCSVELGPRGWVLRDRNSRNGTFCNGEPTRAHDLVAGDVVRIGDHVLLYQELSSDAAQALLSDRRDVAELQGNSPALALLRQWVEAKAESADPVLILGETGVGKELVARALHTRRAGAERAPFVGINCAALPHGLAEAELFGHTRGAFTGAAQARIGLFREAGAGTLFLDEIGELPPALQATLLRALETRELRPVGSDKAITFEARIVAATNRDLDLELGRGGFRSDLFARLMTHVIVVPPLRQHKDDILPLLTSFLASQGASSARPTPDAAEALLTYGWPRNVRELRQLGTRLAALRDGRNSIALECLPREIAAGPAARRPPEPAAALNVPEALLEIPRDCVPSKSELLAVLAVLEHNMTRVAEFFGKDRRQVYRWCERFGITTNE